MFLLSQQKEEIVGKHVIRLIQLVSLNWPFFTYITCDISAISWGN